MRILVVGLIAALGVIFLLAGINHSGQQAILSLFGSAAKPTGTDLTAQPALVPPGGGQGGYNVAPGPNPTPPTPWGSSLPGVTQPSLRTTQAPSSMVTTSYGFSYPNLVAV